MKNIKILALALTVSLTAFNCSNDDDNTVKPVTIDFSGTFAQEDQMGRPAVNTVFVVEADKDAFNVTIPTAQSAAFQSKFEANLLALSPAYADGGLNALGQDAAAFTGLLATDVLNVSLDGKTSFFDPSDGTLLTGRALADDVITVELLLIFGGEDFSENPTLSDDNVSANDKEFLSSFPYLASPH